MWCLCRVWGLLVVCGVGGGGSRVGGWWGDGERGGEGGVVTSDEMVCELSV